MSTIDKSAVYSQEIVSSAEISPQGDSLAPFVIPSWLEGASNPEHIRTVLVQRIPEFASGQLKLQRCKVKLRLEDESGSWTGTCLLTIEGRAQPPQGIESGQTQVVPVRATLTPPTIAEPGPARCEGVFGSDDWFCYIPELYLALETQPLDTGLKGLSILTDAKQSLALLEQNIRDNSPKYHDFRIQTCTPHVMRYKPNSRCTILYDLSYGKDLAANRAWPELVVAKTYSGDKGENAYHAMQALWNSPLRRSRTVKIAEPLAYIPELKVMVQ